MNQNIFYNKIINKKELKAIIQSTFHTYGIVATTNLAEGLKKSGFHFATQAGISISIEDLKVPPTKNKLFLKNNKNIKLAYYYEKRGNTNEIERFQKVIDTSNCATALIYEPPTDYIPEIDRVKFAFDADAVVFSEESEQIYKEQGMDAFHKHESENEDVPLNDGPFAELLRKLSKIQEFLPTTIELTPLRLAIVTARNAPSHMRVIKTLRHWGVYVDEAYFMGGLSKDKVLKKC